LGAGAVFVGWWFFETREPVYHGQKLSAWAQQVGVGEEQPFSAPTAEAVAAICAIGTDALPLAIGWFDPDAHASFRTKCGDLVDYFNAKQRWLHFDTERFKPQPKPDWARAVFFALGTNAQSAIPQLVQRLTTADPNVAGNVAEALVYLGPASIPPLLSVLISTNSRAAGLAAYCLSRFGTNSAAAIPALLQNLKSTNESLANDSAFALAGIAPGSPTVSAALIERLEVADGEHTLGTFVTLDILGLFFASNAIAAVPVLEEIIAKADERAVRNRAIRTLALIDPTKAVHYQGGFEATSESPKNPR